MDARARVLVSKHMLETCRRGLFQNFPRGAWLLVTQMKTEQRLCDAALCHRTHMCLELEAANV